MRSGMEHVKEIFIYFLAAMAMFSLLCAIYETINQRLGSAGVLTGVFVAAALLMYLPQMASFKAFGVEATLTQVQEKLDRADEIISRMKALAAANAEATYSLLAWGNRWGGMPSDDKQKIADKIDAQLKTFDFDDQRLVTIKGVYIYFIAYDLGSYFENAVNSYVIRFLGADSARSAELTAWRKNWGNTVRLSFDKLSKLDGQGLTSLLISELPGDKMKPDDIPKFEQFARRVGEIYSGCLKRQGYTPEAIAFFEEVQPLAGDAFGPLPTEVIFGRLSCHSRKIPHARPIDGFKLVYDNNLYHT